MEISAQRPDAHSANTGVGEPWGWPEIPFYFVFPASPISPPQPHPPPHTQKPCECLVSHIVPRQQGWESHAKMPFVLPTWLPQSATLLYQCAWSPGARSGGGVKGQVSGGLTSGLASLHLYRLSHPLSLFFPSLFRMS